MTAQVVLPVRLVIDSACIGSAPAMLAEPVETALRTALGKAAQDVFNAAAGPPIGRTPTFSWTGDGLALLGEGERAGIEEAISEAVARASRAAGIQLEARTRRSGTVPRPSEPYDPGRDLGDAYLVDAYGGPKAPRARQALGKSGGKGPTAATPAAPRGPVIFLKAFASDFDAVKGTRGEIARALATAGKAFPYDGVFGVAYASPKGDRMVLAEGRISPDGAIAGMRVLFSVAFEVRTIDVRNERFSAGAARASGDLSNGYFELDRVPEVEGPYQEFVTALARYMRREKLFNEAKLDAVGRRMFRDSGAAGRFEAVREDYLQRAAEEAIRHVNVAPKGDSSVLYVRQSDRLPFVLPHKSGGLTLSQNEIIVTFALDTAAATAPATGEAGGGGGRAGQLPAGARSGDGGGSTQQRARPQTGEDPALAERECDPGLFDSGRALDLKIGGRSVRFSLEPFECEPGVAMLGAFGETLQMAMRRIADLLELPPEDYRYAASFAIGAMAVIEARSLNAKAEGCGVPAEVSPTPQGDGDLGAANMTPGESPALARLRALSQAAVLVEEMLDLIVRVYMHPMRTSDGQMTSGLGSYWMHHFLVRTHEARHDMVPRLFADACSVCLMQALAASRTAIDALLVADRFEREFQTIYMSMRHELATVARLEELRARLIAAEARKIEAFLPGNPVTDLPASALRTVDQVPAPRSMAEAKAAIEAKLSATYMGWQEVKDHANRRVLDWSDDIAARRKVVGEPKYLKDGTVVIVDETGKAWRRGELEDRIKLGTGVATSLNPLVRHLRNMRGHYSAFTGAEARARDFFRFVVERMRDGNESATGKTLSGDDYAVEVGQVIERDKSPGVYEVQGIHHIAAEALAPAFKDRGLLDRGVQAKLREMQLTAEFLTVVELGVTITLGLIFAPLGLAVGAAFTVSRLSTALAHADTAEGLLDGEQIIGAARAEMELFFSTIEIVMLAALELPQLAKAGRAITAARGEFRALYKEGAGTAAKRLATGAGEKVLANMAAELSGALIPKLLVQLGMMKLFPLIMDEIFKPLADAAGKQANLEGGYAELLARLTTELGQDQVDAMLRQIREDSGVVEVDPPSGEGVPVADLPDAAPEPETGAPEEGRRKATTTIENLGTSTFGANFDDSEGEP